jgi:hypothetical protein
LKKKSQLAPGAVEIILPPLTPGTNSPSALGAHYMGVGPEELIATSPKPEKPTEPSPVTIRTGKTIDPVHIDKTNILLLGPTGMWSLCVRCLSLLIYVLYLILL